MADRSKKPRLTVAADGRIGWPDIVQYQLPDGSRVAVPPLDGTAYRYVVHDLKRCEKLAATGALFDPRHRRSRAHHRQADVGTER